MLYLVRDQLQKVCAERGLSPRQAVAYLWLFQRLSALTWSWLRARWVLRNAKRLGMLVFAKGPLQLKQAGQLTVANNVRFWSSIHTTQLIIGPKGSLEIADDCFINGALIAAYSHLKIGQGVYLAPMCQIADTEALGWPNASDEECIRPITIAQNAWIATRAIIKPGVHVGEGAVVGVGAVVEKDVPPYAVVGGAPAKVIKYLPNAPSRTAVQTASISS